MTVTLVKNDARAPEWLSARIDGFRPSEADKQSVAWEKDGELLAAVLFRNHAGADVEAVAAADRLKEFFSPQLISAGFSYPFSELGCRRVTVYVASNNAKSRRFVERLGFKQEGTIRQFVDRDIDLLVYGLLREECRWLK
jgi:ribosomal protein S18 acetylase RimI-like enzyme